MTSLKMPNQHTVKLPEEGYVRLNDFLGKGKFLPMSRSTWYSRVRSGEAPAPVSLGARIVAYRVEDIRAYFERFQRGGNGNV
ncbi:helix-turn-helix transcriptional regulator [Rhizobium sp. NRK18]|uniref:helix-turn-helix transcriptional regulator n=1 Tax=Rhizobium sp. NRK18 TaxID=2964667 RepID=UPI0021C38631|nr:AlpA family phage regulatory protein [Rhizobium sp. NRK18]MCQ2002370.1 AlpA family phage regulatory protein [Rhizobium sp. NRK18]